AYLVPAQVMPFHENRVGDLETAGLPHLAEPDTLALGLLMQRVVRHPDEAAAKALAGRQRVLERLTWGHTALRIEERLEALASRPVRGRQPSLAPPAARYQVCFDGQGSRRQRVSLCIIARNEEHNIGA